VAFPAPPGSSFPPRIEIEKNLTAYPISIPGLSVELGVYGREGGAEHENGRRFALFSRAVAAMARGFDVVHAHDWPGAAALYLLREAGGPRPRTVLTIHNLAYQGIFPSDVIEDLGLSSEHFRPDALEFYGHVNLLKAGILAADVVTTVSPRYAHEILQPAYGELLDGVLRQRGDPVIGIVNGINVKAWDPRRDPELVAPFGPDDLAGKRENKRAFLREIGVEEDVSRPLVISLGRIIEQKGIDILAEALPAVVDLGTNVVIAGAGEAELEARIDAATKTRPGRATFLGPIDDTLKRKMLAAADLVLLPSRFEPCGVVQMEARRYGAVPVARKTGGLADTIVDGETGFLFEECSVDGIIKGVKRAIASLLTDGREHWAGSVMRLTPGWERPASLYAHVYERLLRHR